jgi:hypothetical protein
MLFALADLDCDPPTYASHIAGHVPQYPAYLLRWGLTNFVPGLASNHDPSHLYLPSTWDYRYEPSHPA